MQAPGFTIACVAGLVLASAAAFAQLAPDALKEYGGRYAVDCADPASPRVIVTSNALVVEQGTQRMSGLNLQASVSAFGNSTPPAGFVVSLMSETKGGLELTGMVWTDRSGPYVQLDGSPKVRAALGALVNARFHDCDSGRAQRILAQQAADRADTKRDDARRLRNATGNFGRAWRRALGPLAKQGWLAKLAGSPEALDQTVKFGGVEYRYGRACKPHDCYDNNMVVLYSPAQGTIYGKALVALAPSYFGGPPPELQRELDRRWRAEFRQGR